MHPVCKGVWYLFVEEKKKELNRSLSLKELFSCIYVLLLAFSSTPSPIPGWGRQGHTEGVTLLNNSDQDMQTSGEKKRRDTVDSDAPQMNRLVIRIFVCLYMHRMDNSLSCDGGEKQIIALCVRSAAAQAAYIGERQDWTCDVGFSTTSW